MSKGISKEKSEALVQLAESDNPLELIEKLGVFSEQEKQYLKSLLEIWAKEGK